MNRFSGTLARILCVAAFGLLVPPTRAGEGGGLDARFLKALTLRSIGPASVSGRVTDVAVVEGRPSTMYVAAASGGLWKTVNNGTTWAPVFDGEVVSAIGAVAVAPSDSNVVWAGTGEANPRNSVSWGDGVYKSSDGGKTWTNMGLRDSHHIGRIVIHPTDPDIVYVAALGHLWAPNRERGLYKTTDGGRSWRQVKFVNEDTGFIDVAIDPADPQNLYAAAWQVRRDAFAGGNPAVQCGPGSGLFRSGDGGHTWERLTEGLPDRPLGRCGLSVCRKDPRIIYAVVQTDKTSTTTQGQSSNLDVIVTKDDQGKLVRRKVTADDGGIFRSDDRGKTWTWLNSLVPRPFYYGQVRVDPSDVQRVYVLGIWLYVSDDGGQTFRAGNAAAGTHVDYHALWIDPRDSSRLVLGCDGGLNFSYDRGATWEQLKNLPLSQFYAVAVDLRRPYRVYGGLQDNGTWGGPSATRDPAGITFADWFSVFGADGFQCQVDPTDVDIVYAEGQYGLLQRVNVYSGVVKNIKPRADGKARAANLPPNVRPVPPKGAPDFRFNWNAPVLLSSHNPRTLYFGGNHVFRSTDRGELWDLLSPDLTRGPPGPSAYNGHTITTVAESPLKAGLLYAGTDDGRLHLSRDGGQQWLDLSDKIPQLPPERWITRIVCSAFGEGVAYLTIDRHRQDDRAPYVFRTSDFGVTWQALANNLPPTGPVHVIREDPRNQDLLYVGTEFGLFLSCDGGAHWQRHPGVPAVAVHDLVVHPRDQELVVGTHGRGLYILDVTPLQELTPRVLAADTHLFSVKPAAAFIPRSLRNWAGTRMFAGVNPPYGAVLYYYLGKNAREQPTLTITDAQGRQLAQLKKTGDAGKTAGLHQLVWDLRLPADGVGAAASSPFFPRVAPGEYIATLRVDGLSLTRRVRVEGE